MKGLVVQPPMHGQKYSECCRHRSRNTCDEIADKGEGDDHRSRRNRLSKDLLEKLERIENAFQTSPQRTGAVMQQASQHDHVFQDSEMWPFPRSQFKAMPMKMDEGGCHR
jgi:hypothetical protein